MPTIEILDGSLTWRPLGLDRVEIVWLWVNEPGRGTGTLLMNRVKLLCPKLELIACDLGRGDPTPFYIKQGFWSPLSHRPDYMVNYHDTD